MADELDALFDGAEGATPEPTADAAQPDSQAQTTAQQAAQAAKLAELDAVVPESPDIDKAYWGKPVKDVIRVADQHKHEAGVAATRNQQWNQLVAIKEQAEAAAAYWRQKAEGGQQPQPTEEERIQRLSAQPIQEINGMVDQRVSPIQQQLERTEQRLIYIASENARERARQHLQVPPELWETAKPQLAAYIYANGWDTTDPRTWAYAGEQYKTAAAAWAPQAPQPSTAEVPRAGAPPVGGARSQVRNPATVPQLRGPRKDFVGDLSAIFELDEKNTKTFATQAAALPEGFE